MSPMYEKTFPSGASRFRIPWRGKSYNLDADILSHIRPGKNGNSICLPLFGGDEFVGHVPEGSWLKGNHSSAILTPTMILNAGMMEFKGLAAVAGVSGDWWLAGQHPIPLLDGLELTIAMITPTADTGAVANRDINLTFLLTQDQWDQTPVSDPQNDENYLLIWMDIDDTGFLFRLTERVDGTSTALFTGSTYDDASARDPTTTNLAWICRVVFSEADEDNDYRHIHVYVKYAPTLEEAEAADEYQLTTSPYDISSYNFNIGYPNLRVDTMDDTNYFNDSNPAKWPYVKVTYPEGFQIQFNQDPTDMFKDDVEIWEGDPDSQGQRVFDPDHIFPSGGKIYLQNGLIRLVFDDASRDDQPVLYWWTGAAWEQVTDYNRWYLVESALHAAYCFFQRIVSISPEKIVVEFRKTEDNTYDDDIYVDMQLTMERGKYTTHQEVLEVYPFNRYRQRYRLQTTRRFGYALENYVADDDVSETATNTTPDDNYLMRFDDDGREMILVLGMDLEPDQFFVDSSGQIYPYNWNPTTELVTLIKGISPYADILKLQIEAENCTLGGGASAVADAAASGGQAALLDAQNEYVRYSLTAGTDIPSGRFMMIVRVRDINQVVDDPMIQVRNSTDSVYRNEENAQVTFTATATYAYYNIVFDITPQDESDGDEIRIVIQKMLADANEIYVDYILIVPITNGESWPMDLTHAAMREINRERVIVRK